MLHQPAHHRYPTCRHHRPLKEKLMPTPSPLEQALAQALPAQPAPAHLAGLIDYISTTGPDTETTIEWEADDE